VVAEQDREQVEALRAAGVAAVSGDASTPTVLVQAHIARAALLVITVPDARLVRSMVDVARTLNPQVGVLVRARNAAEAELMEADGLGEVFLAADELGRAMASRISERMGAARAGR